VAVEFAVIVVRAADKDDGDLGSFRVGGGGGGLRKVRFDMKRRDPDKDDAFFVA